MLHALNGGDFVKVAVKHFRVVLLNGYVQLIGLRESEHVVKVSCEKVSNALLQDSYLTYGVADLILAHEMGVFIGNAVNLQRVFR